MSDGARADARPKTPKGSVKAARERAEAGLPLQRPPPPPSSSTLLKPPQASAKNVTISRPSPMPQWPLDGSSANSSPPRGNTNSPSEELRTDSPNGNGSPPRRPQRPSNVPSILDASKIQDHTPAFVYRQQEEQSPNSQQSNQNGQQTRYWDPSYLASPNEPTTPGTGLSGASTSSRPSTTSSFGSIPDFPVPTVPSVSQQPQSQPQPRRSIGPPPSARRGASSYYSTISVVTPIPEESTESPKQQQHGSYASSHVIPKSWADGPPEYYMTSYTEEDEDDYELDGRESRESKSTDPDENTGLVRKASLGRQYKPSLTTVRSNGDLRVEEDGSRDHKPRQMGAAGAIAAAAGSGTAAASSAAAGLSSGRPTNSKKQEILSPIAYVDPAEDHFGDASTGGTPNVRSGAATPRGNPHDPRIRQILGGLERGGALGYPEEIPMDERRPPRLDMRAVREAESRGSITSLPDLIRRATRLASNLDKGRTASRLGMLEMFNSSDPNMLAKANAANASHQQRNSSLSGMLSSFPAPAMTPTQDQALGFPSYDRSDRDLITPMSPEKGEHTEKRGRRCCGLPLWLFTLLVILLVLVIAAAVVVPVVLIVLPRENQSPGSGPVDLSNCASSNPCSNGGTSVVSANACQCVCVNKFTGPTCAAADDGSCTTTNVDGFNSATVGNGLPHVLSAASQFAIPLNQTAMLATFAASSISCSSENALISFGGLNQRRELLGEMAINVNARAPQPQAVTSDGVVLASSMSALPTAATVAGTASPSSTSSSQPPSTTDVDLASVAVLWVLQQSKDLNKAVSAQSALLAVFDKSSTPTTVNLGTGVSVDFTTNQLVVNGTKLGRS